MTDTIYPRSPRGVMDGSVHLPRFVDKLRLQLAASSIRITSSTDY